MCSAAEYEYRVAIASQSSSVRELFGDITHGHFHGTRVQIPKSRRTGDEISRFIEALALRCFGMG